MIFPDFKSFSPDQCINQFSYHLYLGQVLPSYFFIEAVPDDIYIPKLNSLCDILNADDSAFQYAKWILYSIISRLSTEIINQNVSVHSPQCQIKKPNIPDSFYLLALDSKTVKSKEATVLLQIFTGKSDFFQKNKSSSSSKPLNTDEQKSVVQAISYLFEKHRGLYTALLRHGYIEALLMRIGPELLFNHFKLNSFSLKEQFDNSYLPFFSIKLVNPTNFHQFWCQYPILFDTKTSQLFQSLFACDIPFPYVSTKYFIESDLNDAILSLTNDVLTKRNKSFIDIILIVCRTLIINGLKTTKDQECLLTYTKQFPDLRMIAFLAEYESIKNEIVYENVISQIINNMNSDSNSISKIESDSIMMDAIERLNNDCSICRFLSNSIGKKTTNSDLEKMSLPKYLNTYANLNIDFDGFKDKKMFVFSDNDRKNDFAFIYSFRAMSLILNQVEKLKGNDSQIDLLDMSSISLTESLSETTLSLNEIDSIFSNNLIKVIEIIQLLTNEEFFEKLIIEFYSILFVSEKPKKSKKELEIEDVNSFVFSDDKIAEIVSILFHFCPKQKEIRKDFLRLKFIKILSQKKFEEAKNLTENEDDPLYKLTMMAELVFKISNSEQWSFPKCIDKSLFDAEYLLSNNEDFGSDFREKSTELNILVGKRRAHKKYSKYSPCYLYDIDKTSRNIEAFNSSNFDKIEEDNRCIQFTDFVDFESKLDKSGIDDLKNLDDIIAFEIKSDKLASLLTLKTVPDEYRDNKFINAIFDKTVNSPQKNTLVDLNEKIQTLEDVTEYLQKNDKKLLPIEKSDIQILLTKSFSFNPLPYEILNDLYYRDSDTVLSFYKPLFDKLKLSDFIKLVPFCFYDYFTFLSKFSDVNENMNLTEYLEFLVVKKKFKQAKNLASDFSLTTQLDSIVNDHFSIEDSQLIEIYFPQLKESLLKKFPRKEKEEFVPSEKERMIMEHLQCFLEFDENDDDHYELENLPTFSNLFNLFDCIKHDFESISTPLMKKIVETVTFLISSSFVDCFDAELAAIRVFPLLFKYVKLFTLKMANLSDSSNYQSLIYKLDCLSRFVFCGFNGTFDEVYSFDDFSTKQAGASFASLCQKYDQTEILRDIQNSWGLFDYRFFDSSLNCIKLGLFKQGNIELEKTVKAHQALKIDCQCLANDLIPILSFLRPIAASSFIRKIKELFEGMIQKAAEIEKKDDQKRIIKSFIEFKIFFEKMIQNESGIEMNDDQEKFFKSLRNQSKEEDIEKVQIPIVHITSPQIISLDKSLSIVGASEDRILFHCQFGDFDEAFNLFNRFFIKATSFSSNNAPLSSHSSSSSNLRLTVFLRVLITPAIAFKQWNGFWLKLVRCLNMFESIIDDFINYLNQNQIFFILLDVQRRLEYNDRALIAAMKLFETTKSWQEQKKLLKTMSLLIQKSLSLSDPEEKKKHKSFFNDDSLFQLQRRVNVQLAVNSMFLNTNAPFDNKLEIMTSKENTLNLGSFLLLRLQIGYFFEICELPDISMEEICECAIEKLNSSENKEDMNLSSFFKNLTRLEAGTYSKLILCLSKSIYRRVPDENTFIEFVTRNIKGNNLIASVLQSFGFENEADEFLNRKSHK
ncbi:hypothetical protein M9Y10_029712 [Tritrichomonas musculus]|uniref:Uncharacterized protein n=1 Tax=Tritrichomonas musculus TaxID=1915356 RepID=A0ABR2KNC1_9EUKA